MKSFEQLDLVAPIKRALADENYTVPTPIQAQTIPAALDDLDVLGCAQTGTGKTAAFALPILNRLAKQKRKPIRNCPIALVLAPTRELAIQIGDSFDTYGKHLNLKTALVYGGVNQNNQTRTLDRGVHILVATPGRLLDLMNQGFIDLGDLEVFVLDEADRMLDMGFLPDLKRIIKALPEDRQSLFFSATMPPKIVELAERLLVDPVSVNVTPKQTSVQRIEQQVVFVGRGGKQTLLNEIVGGPDVDRVIVFTRTKRGANAVAGKLERAGIQASAIHGNKSQNARQRTLEAFRKRKIHVLVATDVAARGIDIDGVTHVINFDIPTEPESYVHRIGRTGRAGADGVAISFCTSEQRDDLRAIESLIGKKIPLSPLQSPVELAEQDRSPGVSSSSGGNGRGRNGGRNGSGRNGAGRSAGGGRSAGVNGRGGAKRSRGQAGDSRSTGASRGGKPTSGKANASNQVARQAIVKPTRTLPSFGEGILDATTEKPKAKRRRRSGQRQGGTRTPQAQTAS